MGNGNTGEKWRGGKNVVKTTKCIMRGNIYNFFKLGYPTVPDGVRTQRHAEGYQPEGKDPQIATEEIHTAFTGG